MASFTLIKSKQKKDGTTPLRIRMNHQYGSAEFHTMWAITDKDLNRKGEIKNKEILDAFALQVAKWRKKLEALGDGTKYMTAVQVKNFLTTEKKEKEKWSLDIIKYAREQGQKLIDSGHEGTGKLRVSAVNSLVKFLGKESLEVNELTGNMLNQWVEWINKQPAIGTRKKGGRAAALYIAQLKAVYNQAKMEFNDEDMGVVRMPFNPFAKVKVSESVPEKRSLTIEQLRALMAIPAQEKTVNGKASCLNLAKDVFMLSFYLMGMNAADLYNCPQQEGDRITYQRTKTRTRRKDHAEISIIIPKEAKALVAKYRGSRSVYFDFSSRYSTVGTFSAALNKGLKEIGKLIKVPDLQFYAARHTWATIAYNDAKIDKGVVSDALNHVDTKASVTDRYIRKDWSRIDEANRKVIDLVLHEQTAAPDSL